MSYYDQWFITNQQPDSPGKRKRDDFYSDGGKYSTDYKEGSGSTPPGRGGGPSTGTYRGGAGGSGRGNHGGNRGGRGRGGYGATNYSDFQQGSTSWQGFSNKNFVSKKQRMMEEISQLEDDTEELMLQERLRALREEKKMREMALNEPYPAPSFNRGGYGRGRGFGRGMPQRDDFGWGHGAGTFRGRGGQGYHYGRGDGHLNRGRGGPGNRYRKKDKKTEQKKERELEENNPYEYKLELREEIDMEARDQRLLTLMKLIKSFDFRSSPAQTLRHCIRNHNLNIQVYFYKNKSVLYLDQLFIARGGTQRNQKSDTYTQAIHKLKTLSLEEIKAEAEKAGEFNVYPEKRQFPAHTMEEIRKMTTPIEIAEFPFRRRLELFCVAVNRHDPNINCTKLYCTKYAMNLRSVYTFHPEETENRQHIRIYLCEMFVCEAIGKDRGRCDRQCINKFYETLKTKTIDEMLENDGRYSKEVFQPPTSIQYKGVGQQDEDNLCRLASLGPGTIEAAEKNTVDDIVIIEKKSYDGSWCKILEDSVLYNRLKLTYVWDIVHPGGELPEIGTEKKMEFEVDLIREGRKSGKKAKSSRKAEINLEEDKVFADTNEMENIEKHKEAVAQRAREYRVMMISCKVFLQDKLVGEGFSIYRRCAQQVASAITYKNLFAKHSAIYLHDDDKHENQDFDYQDIIKKAEKLFKELPKQPVFEDFNQSRSNAGADLPAERQDIDNGKDHEDNDDKSDEDDQSDDDVDNKIETGEQNNETAKRNDKTKEAQESKTSGKTIFFHEKEEELLPWIREVVKRDLEKLAISDVLWKGHVVYRGYPSHIHGFLRFCAKKYGLDIRSRMDKGKKSGVILTKPLPQVKDMVQKLMESPDKCSNKYTLEQRREPDGYLVVYHKLVKKSSLKLPKQKQDTVDNKE